jgi:transposase-like protein
MGKTIYSAKFKADRVLEVLLGEEQLGAIASKHNLNPNMLRSWKKEFLEKSSMVFDESRREKELAAREREMEAQHEELLKTVGQLTLERDWLKKKSIEVFGSDYEKRFSKKPF